MTTGTAPSGPGGWTLSGGGGGAVVGGGVITDIWTVVAVVAGSTPAAATVPSPVLAFAVTAGSVAEDVGVTGEAIGPEDGGSVVVVWPKASNDMLGGVVVGVAADSEDAGRGLQPAAASRATAPSVSTPRRTAGRVVIGEPVPGWRRAPGGGGG
jgi:hypothetical protein